ncbi:V-set and immunoglobulin domain-containing protein 10-like [Nibea albiflora]|nr:V-set and immunoglobulin domain-containing protein 10-like [Nibea albiflora]
MTRSGDSFSSRAHRRRAQASADCELVVSPVGPTQVKALAGSNVTLVVSFSGATDPALTWFMRGFPVVTWAINSRDSPRIAENSQDVLKLERNGSLTFVNVLLNYTSNYTIEMTKAGLGTASTSFNLTVYEKFLNVSLSAEPSLVKEGTGQLTMIYNMKQGVVEQQMWFFNDKAINTNSHYLIGKQSLVISKPNRNNTGLYRVSLANPFSAVTSSIHLTVLYGPENPKLEAQPAKPFYVAGTSLNLSCQAEGSPEPTVEWVFGGGTLSRKRVLNLINVQSNQTGNYTCILRNNLTGEQWRKNIPLKIYEMPLGNPKCSVHALNNATLQYRCLWSGGNPQAQLSFPALSNTSTGAGTFSLAVTASSNLNGKTVTCMAGHPIQENKCNITASGPMKFLPLVRATVPLQGKIVVTIECFTKASPAAVVSWSKGSESITNGTTYQISDDTTRLEIQDYNVDYFLNQSYACTCSNPLGSQRREIQLLGPLISDFRWHRNEARTVVTLTWEVPSMSVVTGFAIQMKGPDILSKNQDGTQKQSSKDGFNTIRDEPGHVRSVDIFPLDPKLTYRFRVIPKARLTEGKPSEVHRVGPDLGLSGPAIAGIAAGIPCSILFLCLLAGVIYLCFSWNKNNSWQTRYPVPRAVEKVITIQTETAPHNLMTGGLKAPPDYNRLHQRESERSMALPTFVPAPPVRVATTV